MSTRHRIYLLAKPLLVPRSVQHSLLFARYRTRAGQHRQTSQLDKIIVCLRKCIFNLFNDLKVVWYTCIGHKTSVSNAPPQMPAHRLLKDKTCRNYSFVSRLWFLFSLVLGLWSVFNDNGIEQRNYSCNLPIKSWVVTRLYGKMSNFFTHMFNVLQFFPWHN